MTCAHPFCFKEQNSGVDDVRPLLIEAIFEEAERSLTLTRQVKDSLLSGRNRSTRTGWYP